MGALENQLYHFRFAAFGVHNQSAMDTAISVDLDKGTVDPALGGLLGGGPVGTGSVRKEMLKSCLNVAHKSFAGIFAVLVAH